MTRVGESFEGPVLVANAPSMKVIAALLRDPNPIHFDRAAAKKAGRGRLLVGQGPVSAAVLYQAALDHWPGSILVSASLRYLANVIEDDQIRAKVTVTAVTVDPAGELVELDVSASDARGVEKARGNVVVRLPV